MAKLSQKDYLKKYLSSDSKLKKKNKKSKSDGKPKINPTVRIIDDDDYIDSNLEIDESDLYATNEEAPQIVGEIDDRPPELQVLDYRQNSKWKSLASVETKEQSKTSQSKICISSDESPPRKRGNRSEERIVRKRKNSSDNSPPRSNKNNRSSDYSPPRKTNNNNNNRSPDNSPPRRNNNRSQRDRTPDNSPPKRNNNKSQRDRSPDNSPPKRNNDKSQRDRSPDNSPPRRNNNKSQRNHSPDNSPPRSNKNSNNRSPDNSPPRRNNNRSQRDRTPDNSPPRRNNNKSQRDRSPDNSPQRRNNNKTYAESSRKRNSPDVQRQRTFVNNSDNSPPRRRRSTSRNRFSSRESPPRRIKTEESRIDDIKREPSPPRSSKMTKTLDGKASGLQDAKTLRKENDAFKEKQDRLFDEMRPEMSGKNADLVVRERRGRNRDFDQEMEEERQKSEFEAARKQVYDRWGKGLKQIEDFEKRTEEYKHEVNKPLARLADDQDLQDHLKDQERSDDPMLQYMRKKKTEENRKKGIEEKPLYKGQFPQNRYNIPPGYRWDGVDRSSGYEKKLFEVSAAKKAGAEEAYRYATEDM
ncbi:unnamed protein product [Diamesa serratosioi]